jgi:hypothetical protein
MDAGDFRHEAVLHEEMARMAAFGKGFGCRPGTSDRPGVGGPTSESLR